MVPQNKGVYHLKGGIHKYLEEFGNNGGIGNHSNADENDEKLLEENNAERKSKADRDGSGSNECLFVGKNFVFDRRGALGANDCVSKSVSNSNTGLEQDKTKGVMTKNYQQNNEAIVVGQCLYCSGPYDVFLPENICTVCREPILICPNCKLDLHQKQQLLRGVSTFNSSMGVGSVRSEYHCEDHFHLKSCYFTNLYGFSNLELDNQMKQLQDHSKPLEGIGKKGKQRRRTLRKQIDKIESFMKDTMTIDNNADGKSAVTSLKDGDIATQCRHCGSSTCAADCWGFHGGNTRMMNKNTPNDGTDGSVGNANVGSITNKDNIIKPTKKRTRTPSNQRSTKRLKREKDLEEISSLQLCQPPSQYWHDVTGMRVPPPVVRVLRSTVKGRWCGKTLGWMMTNEFGEFAKDLSREETIPIMASGEVCKKEENLLDQLIDADLIRINGVPVSKLVNSTLTPGLVPTKSSDILLRNMDTIERVVHWHEPPVFVPKKISLTKHSLQSIMLSSSSNPTNNMSTECADTKNDTPMLYCINKPQSIPVYPAGPYYANSLLLMVEAQEGLQPKSLIPCHRIDRATSGVLLCANMSSVASVVQGRMTTRGSDEIGGCSPVKKLYLARVKVRKSISERSSRTMLYHFSHL